MNDSSIDWQSQWEMHGLNFYNGHVHIDQPQAITDSWKKIKLAPGPGFGDLSHPTTRLMLKMMKPNVCSHVVVDIGCGSGVLSLSAVALGAQHVYSIDIDEAALLHARHNAILNNMDSLISFCLPHQVPLSIDSKDNLLILMNMIMTEQQVAWTNLKQLHHQPGCCITSGILVEGQPDYLHLVEAWGWSLNETEEEKGWLAMKFNDKKKNGQ